MRKVCVYAFANRSIRKHLYMEGHIAPFVYMGSRVIKCLIESISLSETGNLIASVNLVDIK